VRDSFRQIKKQNAEDNVNGEKLDAFDPVGFAVAADSAVRNGLTSIFETGYRLK
jgi:hypothetical protein